jgi:hypothetical protein
LFPALGLDLLKRDPINARCAVVFPTAAKGFFDDIIPIDLVPESVEAGGRFSLSFRV